MKLAPPSAWDQTQLALLRVLSRLLALVDRVFNVHWGEQILARMARRWQAQLERLDLEIIALEKEHSQTQLQAEALVIHAATLYLAGRMMAYGELRFDPAIPRDEEILDATIDMLVKQRLATIESEEIEQGHFVYHLEPNWQAIYNQINAIADGADPEFADWFRESLKLVEETLQGVPDTQSQPAHSNPQ